MIPCERFKDTIFNLLDDELDTHQRHDLEKHLKSCSSCSQLLDRCRLLKGQLQNLSQLSTSETFHLLLRERIRRELSGRRRRGLLFPSPIVRSWIPAVTVALLLITVGILLRDRESFVVPGNKSKMAEMRINTSPAGENVEYVRDNYTDGVSLSRDDSKRNQIQERDSLLLQQETEIVRPHLTPVSF
jgi:anti-sigma factor RsiW